MNTKEVNVFNPMKRKVKCIANRHDYLGTGEIFIEDKLEVGKVYTMIKGQRTSYGCMIFLDEVESECGFQHYLFEEMKEYDISLLKKDNEKFINSLLQNTLARTKYTTEEGKM